MSPAAGNDAVHSESPRFQGPQPPQPLPAISPYGGPVRERDGLADQLKGASLAALRRYGALTAHLRMTPDYLIIGTKRGGSTSLARWVLQHPDVGSLFPARETRKGTYYFDVNYNRGSSWYRSHFPTRVAVALQSRRSGSKQVIGEAVPYYLHHPHAPSRARSYAPDAKIIALLRDPVQRAFGHWGERTRNGVEWLPFDQALAAESERLDGEEERMIADPDYTSFAHQHFGYVDQGRYERGLGRWIEQWPASQLLILRSEDMYQNPADVYGQVLDFLGLKPFEPAEFGAWNMKATSSLPPEQESSLRQLLQPSIDATEKLLNREMGWS